MPDLDALELLLAIGRTGSFARAGAERGISQPAVSQRVRSIERLVGVGLVERGPSGSRLTVEGALVADWAREVLRAAEQLDAGIGSLRGQMQGRLRIAASLTIAEQLLPAWLNRLRSSEPGTAVSLAAVNSAAAADLVLTRQVGLGFIESPQVPRGLASRSVGSDRLLLVCSPDSSLARRRRRPLAAAELAGLRLVEREAGSGTRASLDAALAAATDTPLARPTPLLEVSSTAAGRAAVSAGVGPAVMSSLAVRDEVQAGRMVEVPTAGLDLRRELRAVWVRGGTLVGVARDLLAIATASAGPGRG